MSYFGTDSPRPEPIKYTLWLVPEHEDAKKFYDYKSITYPYNENAGFDLRSMNSSFDPAVGHRKAFMADLGVRAMMTRGDTLIPENTVHYRLVPRSSIYKTGYMMANSEGIIDRTYTGVLKAPLVHVNGSSEHAGMWEGNSYFQIVAPDLGWIYCVRIVSSLPTTKRGDGGFGSTNQGFSTIYSSSTGTSSSAYSTMTSPSSFSTSLSAYSTLSCPSTSSFSTIAAYSSPNPYSMGPSGATGATGATGPSGATGASGAMSTSNNYNCLFSCMK